MPGGNEYLAKLGLDVDSFTKDIAKAVDGLEDFKGQSRQLDKDLGSIQSTLNNTSKGLQDFAKRAASVGRDSGGSATGINKAVRALDEYNRALENLQKTGAGKGANINPKATLGISGAPSADAGVAGEQARVKQGYDKISDAAQRAAKMQKDAANAAEANLGRLRYALFDVSNLVGLIGLGLVGVPAGVASVAIQWEKSFTEVIRTTGVTGRSLDELRDQFVGLAQDMPTSFADLSAIGGLAGQLGVAESQIAQFTEAVAQFSSTSNVTVDASATAFGRLDALLPGVKGNFEALGSSILTVGINSVATEGDIVSTSSQIAAAGAQANLTAGEVIGLSGALASVGVAPEAARGTVLRVFSQINGAISGTNSLLDDFAATAGITGEEFRTSFSDGNGGFSDTFVKFLQGIDANGQGAEAALNALGITATRDVNAMLKLSQNTDLLASALADGTAGFENTTALAESFATTAGTVSARIQKLGNNFQAFIDTIGKGSLGPIGFVVDGLTGLLQLLTRLADNPVLSTSVVIGAGLTVLAGTLAIVSAVALRGVAGFLALKTSLIEAASQGLITNGVIGRLAVSYGVLSKAQLEASVATRAANQSMAQTGVSAGGAAGGVGKLAGLLGKAGLVGSMLLLIPLISQVAGEMTNAFSSGLRDLQGTSFQVDELTASFENAKTQLADFKFQAFGNDFLAGSGGSGEFDYGIQKWILDTVGAIPLLTQGASQFDADIAKIDQALVELLDSGQSVAASALFSQVTANLKEQGFTSTQVAEQLNTYKSRLSELGGAAGAAANDVALLSEQMNENLKVLADSVGQNIAVEESLYSLGESLFNNGSAFGYYSAEGRANISALQATIAAYTTAAGGDAQTLANTLGALYNYIVQNANAPVQALSMIQAAIAGTGAKAVTGFTSNLGSLSSGFQKARSTAAAAAAKIGGGSGSVGRAAQETAKKVRTLSDYVSDLSGIFGKAFEFRFDQGTALDQVTSGWNKVADSIADANERQRELNASMQQLTSDRSVQQYYLSIADKYGEQVRAGVLRAKIADIDEELAQKQRELAKAQDEANKSLSGNTSEAIENRAEILGIVASYRDYISTLANSGLSQEELKKRVAQLKAEFLAQGQSMGYSAGELATYAAGFDDFSTIISRLPRDITLSVNIDPALRALEEYTAKLEEANRKTADSSGGGGGGGGGIEAIDPYDAGLEAAASFYAGYSNQQLIARRQEIVSQQRAYGQAAAAAAAAGDQEGYERATAQIAALETELSAVDLEEKGRKAANTWNAGYGVNINKGSAQSLLDVNDKMSQFAVGSSKSRGSEAGTKFTEGFQAAPKPVPNLAPTDPYKQGKDSASSFWSGFNSIFNEISTSVAGSVTKQTGRAKPYATGGQITGPGTGTSDSVPILASDGEFMIREKAARALGPQFLNSLNSMQPGRQLRFATGGPIGGGGSRAPMPTGSNITYLSAEDRALLRDISERISNIEVDFVDAAEAVNKGNKRLQGSN